MASRLRLFLGGISLCPRKAGSETHLRYDAIDQGFLRASFFEAPNRPKILGCLQEFRNAPAAAPASDRVEKEAQLHGLSSGAIESARAEVFSPPGTFAEEQGDEVAKIAAVIKLTFQLNPDKIGIYEVASVFYCLRFNEYRAHQNVL